MQGAPSWLPSREASLTAAADAASSGVGPLPFPQAEAAKDAATSNPHVEETADGIWQPVK